MKTYSSFKELAIAQGISLPQEKAERARKCKACGAEMIHIAGTNVYVCRNEITRKRKNKDTQEEYEVTEPCGNAAISKAG